MSRYLILFLVVTLAVPASAAAQQTTTPTTATSANVTDVPGDPGLDIVQWRYSDSTFRITFRAESVRQLSLTTINNSSQGISAGTVVSRRIGSGETNISVAAPSGVVWVSSTRSASNGRFLQIRAADGSSGSTNRTWGSDDLAAVGFAVSIVFTLALAWQILRARLGLGQGGERVA